MTDPVLDFSGPGFLGNIWAAITVVFIILYSFSFCIIFNSLPEFSGIFITFLIPGNNLGQLAQFFSYGSFVHISIIGSSWPNLQKVGSSFLILLLIHLSSFSNSSFYIQHLSSLIEYRKNTFSNLFSGFYVSFGSYQ